MALVSKHDRESADAKLAPMPVAEEPLIAVSTPPPRRSLLDVLTGAASKSVWALADQAVVSVGNYATVILVARNLPDARQFGTFNLLLAILLFLNSLQQALVIYPLLVRGAVLDRPGMQRLATGCLLATLALCVPLGIGFSCTSLFFAGTSLLLWAPLTLVFQQLQETVRRSLLSHLRFAAAIPGDAISYLAQAAIFFYLGHRLTLPLAFAVIALTSAAAVIVQALQIGLRRFPLGDLKALAADFWPLSRWMLYANLGTLVTGLSYDLTLSLRWGFAPEGYFAAIANLAKLVNPLSTALSGLIVPTVSRAKAGGGTRFAMRVGLRYAAIGMAALAVYFGLLALFPETCLRLMYSKHHPEYLRPEMGGYLRLLVGSWTLMFITNMTLAILNGLGYSRANFISTVANGIVTLAVALPLIWWLGLKGTIVGGLVATGAATVVAVYSFIRHHDDAGNEPPVVPAG
jgi:O-antigen/teichoic acid export membrane protein